MSIYVKVYIGGIMKKLIVKCTLACAALGLGSSAIAAVYGHIWAMDAFGQRACFAKNAVGEIAVGSVSVPPDFCRNAYAWARDQFGTITCLPITVRGGFLPGAYPSPTAACAKSYVFARDAYGQVACYGQGPDGNPVPGIPAVNPSFCNNN